MQEEPQKNLAPSPTSQIILTKKPGHKDSITSCCSAPNSNLTPNPNCFFTASDDATIRLWDLRKGGAIKMFSSPIITENISDIIYDPISETLIAASNTNVLLP